MCPVVRHNCFDFLAFARTNGHLSMWNLPEGHECLSVARWQVADLLRQERESDGPSLVWCMSVTTTRACPPRTRHHCNRRPHCSHRRSDREDGFTKLMCYSFGSQHSGTCTRQHSCVFVLFGWIPKHVREHVMANPSGVEDAPDTTTPHLFQQESSPATFHCIGKLL